MNQSSALNKLRPEKKMRVFIELQKKDIGEYAKLEKEDVLCAVCSSDNNYELYNKQGFVWKKCKQCGFVYISPRPDSERISQFYRYSNAINYFNKEIKIKTRENRKENIFQYRVDDLIRKLDLNSNSSILDIGAGLGEFLECLAERGYHNLTGIDLNNYSNDFLKKYSEVEIINESMEQVSLEREFDIITMWEFIVHTYNPFDILKKVYKLLKYNGTLIISTPNIESVEYLVLKDKSLNISPIFLNYFSPSTITKLLVNVGFKKEKIQISTPGKIDIDNIEREYILEDIILGNYKFIKFIIEKGTSEARKNFQDFLVKSLLSGHMICEVNK